jgi:hypothetical protein
LYAHRFAPRKFTQPQLFACLVLKAFFKTDYRGMEKLLRDLRDLRWVLGLEGVPHFTTLHKACKRLLRLKTVNRLLTATVKKLMRRRRKVKYAAFDSTGLQCGHASTYYVKRRARGAKDKQEKREKEREKEAKRAGPAGAGNGKGKGKRGKGDDASLYQTTTYTRYAKLELGCVADDRDRRLRHLIIAAIPSRGPRPDVDRLVPLLEQALGRVGIDVALADAGYDSEPNHRYARDGRGVRTAIPAAAGRPSKSGVPKGKYRRLMKRKLDKDYLRYGQRWQAETVMSMIKRRLGSVVAGRSYWSQCRDLMLLALTHNCMVVAEAEANEAAEAIEAAGAAPAAEPAKAA